MYLQCAPYAPKATAAAPDKPANRTEGDPCRTNLSKFGMLSSDIYVTTSSDKGMNSSISADFGSSAVGCIQDKKIDIIPLKAMSFYTLFDTLT